MSEEEETHEEQILQRKVIVEVKKTQDTEDAGKWRDFVKNMQTELAEKHDSEVFFKMNNIDEMVRLSKRLEGKEKTRSTGAVSLKKPSDPEEDIWNKEFEDGKTFVSSVYQAWRNEKDPEKKERLKDALDMMKGKKYGSTRNITVQLRQAPKGLKPNHNWYEYGEFVREQARKRGLKNE